jgi:hypothetical protein
MGLESATYISGLVDTNPAGSDNISQGDDHLKLIKSVLKTTLPNANAVINGIHSGSVAPTSTTNGLLWFDEGNDILTLYDGGRISLLYTDGSAAPIGSPLVGVTHKIDSTSNRPASNDTYENNGLTVTHNKVSATSSLYIQLSLYINGASNFTSTSSSTITGYLGGSDASPSTIITGTTAGLTMVLFDDVGEGSGVTWDFTNTFSRMFKVTAANCPDGTTGNNEFNWVWKFNNRDQMTQVSSGTWMVWEVED